MHSLPCFTSQLEEGKLATVKLSCVTLFDCWIPIQIAPPIVAIAVAYRMYVCLTLWHVPVNTLPLQSCSTQDFAPKMFVCDTLSSGGAPRHAGPCCVQYAGRKRSREGAADKSLEEWKDIFNEGNICKLAPDQMYRSLRDILRSIRNAPGTANRYVYSCKV